MQKHCENNFNNDMVEVLKMGTFKKLYNVQHYWYPSPPPAPPIVCFYLRFLLDFDLPWNIKIVLNIIQPHYFKFMCHLLQ